MPVTTVDWGWQAGPRVFTTPCLLCPSAAHFRLMASADAELEAEHSRGSKVGFS